MEEKNETLNERSVPYEERIPYDGPLPTKQNTQPLSPEFGRELITLERARQWLTNPHNWHDSRLFVLHWNGLLCTINKEHAARIIREWWDDGLPWAACYQQRRRKLRGDRNESMDEAVEGLASGDGSGAGSDD